MKPLRLAAGPGFYGDSWLPVRASIERGDVQFVCADHLSELTLAILAKDRQRDPALGYARDLVPMLLDLLPLALPRGVKFVLNAGGLNPPGAQVAVEAALARAGLKAHVAIVTGDALLSRLGELGLDPRDAHGQPLADRLLFANAYLGARGIVDALAGGADIVITGRVADAALFLGPLVHHFGWAWDDWDRLAAGAVVGHLLECSAQAAGGNFAGDWQGVPDLAHGGFPLAEVEATGVALVTKAPGTGGRVSSDTLREQLLYEVHDPHAYHTPDVTVDLGGVTLLPDGPDRVRVAGARGFPPPPTLKVVAGYADGWVATALLGYAWPDAVAKARAAAAMLKVRAADLAITDCHVEILGLDSLHGPLAPLPQAEPNEVYLRVAVRAEDRRVAEAFTRLVPPLALAGPPGAGGWGGLTPARELMGFWVGAVPREVWGLPAVPPVERPIELPTFVTPVSGPCTRRLVDFATARSGDKGSLVDIGLFARDEAAWGVIRRHVTAERVLAHFAPLGVTHVELWPLPRLQALNIVLHDALPGGAARTLRSDNLGKTLGSALLRLMLPEGDA